MCRVAVRPWALRLRRTTHDDEIRRGRGGREATIALGFAIDREALTRLYRDYGPVVHRRARVLLGNEEEANDAMQEVFVRVIAELESYRSDAPILHWIYRITTHVCLDRLRKKKTHPTISDPQAVERLIAETHDENDRRAVLQVLGRMDQQTQALAIHHYVDGMKMEEVAEVVGLSRKTVGKKLAMFRERARRMLGGER